MGGHSPLKKQFILRLEDKYQKLLALIMASKQDENKTELLKRLIEEEAKRKGLK